VRDVRFRPPYTDIELSHSRRVDDVRPFITRDVKDFSRCGADTMLQELLYSCRDTSKPLPESEKSTLLKTCLEAVLPICKNDDIKNCLTDL